LCDLQEQGALNNVIKLLWVDTETLDKVLWVETETLDKVLWVETETLTGDVVGRYRNPQY
jgi:hypothetical protein